MLIAVCALLIASRIVTVALLATHAPEDAEPNFFLQQFLISAACVGAIGWLCTRRDRQQKKRNSD